MKLHLGNLSPEVTEEDIKEIFGKYGPIVSIELEWSRKSSRTVQAVLLEMHVDCALNAVREWTGRVLHNRPLAITLMGG